MRAHRRPALSSAVFCLDRQGCKHLPTEISVLASHGYWSTWFLPREVFTFPTLLSVLGETVEATNESLSMTIGFVERRVDREQTLFDLLERALNDLLQSVQDGLQSID